MSRVRVFLGYGSVSLHLLCIFKSNPTNKKPKSPTKLTKCTMALTPPGWDGCFLTRNSFYQSWIPAPGFRVPSLSPSWKTAKLYKLTSWVHSSIPKVPAQTKLLHSYTQAWLCSPAPPTLVTTDRDRCKTALGQHLPSTHENGTSAAFILHGSGSLLPNAMAFTSTSRPTHYAVLPPGLSTLEESTRQ